MDRIVIILVNPTDKELDLVKDKFTKEPETLNKEQLRFKLVEKGYRKIKSMQGLLSFCRKHNIPYTKNGREYLFENPVNLMRI
jgi:hypothetical protein